MRRGLVAIGLATMLPFTVAGCYSGEPELPENEESPLED